jgi:fucose 4-O-acetylase-like acetyltransferase
MRNKAIDIEKGIGIILVVFGHNWVMGKNNEELFRIIYSFHVPLFFFLSGVLFQPNINFLDLIKQKWHSILKPYFVVLLGVALSIGISAKVIPYGNLIGILFATGQSILWTPMWFLPNLFITVVFSWWLIRSFKLREKTFPVYFIILIMFMIGVWLINVSHSFNFGPLSLTGDRVVELTGLPFSIDLIFISAAYFMLGNMLSKFAKNYKFNLILFTSSLIIYTISHYFSPETMDLNYRVYGDPILSTMQAICGIYLIVVLSEAVKSINAIEVVFSYIGSGSLFILIFHGVLQGKAIYRFQKLFPDSGLIGGLFGLLAGIACPLLIWEVVKRIPIASAFLLPLREEVVTKS